jgi:hypothetical protein
MRYRVLRVLVMLFATHALRCRNGNTPLDWAIDLNKPELVAFLRSVGAPQREAPSSPFHFAGRSVTSSKRC